MHEIDFAKLARDAVADTARAGLPLLPDSISSALTDVMSGGMPERDRRDLGRQIRAVVAKAVAEYRLREAKPTEVPS